MLEHVNTVNCDWRLIAEEHFGLLMDNNRICALKFLTDSMTCEIEAAGDVGCQWDND